MGRNVSRPSNPGLGWNAAQCSILGMPLLGIVTWTARYSGPGAVVTVVSAMAFGAFLGLLLPLRWIRQAFLVGGLAACIGALLVMTDPGSGLLGYALVVGSVSPAFPLALRDSIRCGTLKATRRGQPGWGFALLLFFACVFPLLL